MGFVDDKQNDQKFYYCSKTVRFPLKSVVKAIYDLFKSNNAEYLEFDTIYDFLRDSFNVKSFNRKNLYGLLGSYTVPFSVINNLYLSCDFPCHNIEIYALDSIKKIFIDNATKMQNIIAFLGGDFLVALVERGQNPLIEYVNSIAVFLNNGIKPLQLSNKCESRLFNEQTTKIFIQLLKSCMDDEWIELLSDKNMIREYISMFSDEKDLEQQKIMFKESIISLVAQINNDNANARIKYFFPAQISYVLEKQDLFLISDIVSISNESITDCYGFRDAFLNLLKKLNVSIPRHLNEHFKYLLQLANKNYKPNSLWETYVSFIEKRADGLTLEKSGEERGVTRERVRQLEKKYLNKFTLFFHSNKGIGRISNLIRSCCENALFIQNSDIDRLFEINPKVFKYFLKNIGTDDISYIDELDKFYFIDDFDWYKELVAFGENMPEQFDAMQLNVFINNALEMLRNNDVEISVSDCETILLQDYSLIGTVFSKTKLNLADRFKRIMKQFYPYPVNIYNEQFISDFKKHYCDVYNDNVDRTAHAVTTVISRIGMLAGRGEYILNDRTFMSKELAEKIYQYIINSERKIFLTNTLFSVFKEDLLSEGINNKYFMQGALKQQIGDKLYFRRDYISTTKEDTSIYGEIANFIKDCKRVVSYEELLDAFPSTPWNVLVLGASQEGVLNYRAKYIHIDSLCLNDSDIQLLQATIEKLVSDNSIHHVNDLLAYLNLTNINLLKKLFIEDQFSLFSLLDYLFEGQFEFKRPFIAKVGITIENQTERLKEFINSEDELTIDSILDFVNDNKFHMTSIIQFVDGLDNYIFKDNTSIINIEKTNVNKYNTQIVENMILKAMGKEEFIYADKINFYGIMPKEVVWTPWLLYSAINKYGQKLKAIPSDSRFKFKNTFLARPIIINKDIPATNLNEYVEYLRKNTTIADTDFYILLKQKGLV